MKMILVMMHSINTWRKLQIVFVVMIRHFAINVDHTGIIYSNILSCLKSHRINFSSGKPLCTPTIASHWYCNNCMHSLFILLVNSLYICLIYCKLPLHLNLLVCICVFKTHTVKHTSLKSGTDFDCLCSTCTDDAMTYSTMESHMVWL